MYATCPKHLFLPNSITITVFGEEYKLELLLEIFSILILLLSYIWVFSVAHFSSALSGFFL
jgi:hypothetical protein